MVCVFCFMLRPMISRTSTNLPYYCTVRQHWHVSCSFVLCLYTQCTLYDTQIRVQRKQLEDYRFLPLRQYGGGWRCLWWMMQTVKAKIKYFSLKGLLLSRKYKIKAKITHFIYIEFFLLFLFSKFLLLHTKMFFFFFIQKILSD